MIRFAFDIYKFFETTKQIWIAIGIVILIALIISIIVAVIKWKNKIDDIKKISNKKKKRV